MTTDASQLRIDSSDGDVVVAGEIDANSCGDLDAALAEATGPEVRVDLMGVTFIDSSGLRVLVQHHHRLSETGDTLRIVRPSRPARRLLEIAGLDTQFHVDAD